MRQLSGKHVGAWYWATLSLRMKLTLKTESLLIFSYALHYTAIAVILVTCNYYITHPVMTGRVLQWVGVFSREMPKLSKICPPPSLGSHLSSLLMDVLLRDHGSCYAQYKLLCDSA